MNTDMEFFLLYKYFNECLTKIKTNQILLITSIYWIPVTTLVYWMKQSKGPLLYTID